MHVAVQPTGGRRGSLIDPAIAHRARGTLYAGPDFRTAVNLAVPRIRGIDHKAGTEAPHHRVGAAEIDVDAIRYAMDREVIVHGGTDIVRAPTGRPNRNADRSDRAQAEWMDRIRGVTTRIATRLSRRGRYRVYC